MRERGVSIAQAARDLDVHENLLRNWVKNFADDPREASPGHGRMKAAEAEIERLRREVQQLTAGNDAAAIDGRGLLWRCLALRDAKLP